MRNYKTLNIKNILANSPLATIMQKGLLLSNLNRYLQQQLPPQFQGQFRVANIQGDQLCIEVNNASTRQALLFKQQSLLKLVQQQQPDIHQLSIRINPHLNNG